MIHISVVPRFIINLDLPPSERWDEIIEVYSDEWKVVENQVLEEVSGVVGKPVSFVLEKCMKFI